MIPAIDFKYINSAHENCLPFIHVQALYYMSIIFYFFWILNKHPVFMLKAIKKKRVFDISYYLELCKGVNFIKTVYIIVCM